MCCDCGVMKLSDDAVIAAALSKEPMVDIDEVTVQLLPAEVLPRAPLLQRPQAANFLIADAYAAHEQLPARRRDLKPKLEREQTAKQAVKSNTRSIPEPALSVKVTVKKSPLKSKPAADEFDAAFILHAYPYKETSLILETFTRKHGRVSMVARGAKRPHGALTSARSPFQPLNLVWMGKSDLKTLKTAESGAIFPQLQGTALLSAFYLNELLLKLCAKEDPQPALFDVYRATLQCLIEVHYRAQATVNTRASATQFAADFTQYAAHLKQIKRDARAEQIQQIAIALRQFELTLFQHLGYGLNLTTAAHSGLPIEADADYYYLPDHGAVAIANVDATVGPSEGGNDCANVRRKKSFNGLQLRGKTLLDIANACYVDPITQLQSKQLVRLIINHLLGSQVLHTRSLIAEFAELK